jgi:hypothetical protein
VAVVARNLIADLDSAPHAPELAAIRANYETGHYADRAADLALDLANLYPAGTEDANRAWILSEAAAAGEYAADCDERLAAYRAKGQEPAPADAPGPSASDAQPQTGSQPQ